MSPDLLYQLYAYPNTYSIGVHLLLEEAAAPYKIINPKLDPADTDAAFYQASPHGRVPALNLPNGASMCESGAIALHLADSLANQQFSVNADSVDRGRYLQWLFYLSSTLQPEVMKIFHPEYYFQDKGRQGDLVEASMLRLEQVWQVLEKEYSRQNSEQCRHSVPWMFDHGPTAVDFALATVLLWPECFPDAPQTYPSLSRVLEAVSQRHSYKRIMPWHRGRTHQVPEAFV